MVWHMARVLVQPGMRRIALIGLILLAGCLVSAVIWVIVADPPVIAVEGVFPEPVYPNPELRPRFVFADEQRTYDLSLNRFVDRFFRVCAEGRYSEFRLMLSTKVMPRRFESMFNALKEAKVLSIKKLPPLPEIEGPVYILTSEYELEDYASQGRKSGNIMRLAISKEGGEWRFGRIPHDALARLEAFEQSEPQGSDRDSFKASPGGISPKTPETKESKAVANRPARIDPH